MSEYWIIGHSAIFADGDIGDKGHAAHVVEHCAGRVVSAFGGDEDEALQVFINGYMNQHQPEDEESAEAVAFSDPVDAFLDYVKEHKKWEGHFESYKEFEDYVFIGLWSRPASAIVEFGIKTLRWVRYAQRNIECADFTQLHDIVEGLYDIDSEFTDDDLFNLDIGGTYFSEVPLHEIEALTPMRKEPAHA